MVKGRIVLTVLAMTHKCQMSQLSLTLSASSSVVTCFECLAQTALIVDPNEILKKFSVHLL